jgi:hypothetical protein
MRLLCALVAICLVGLLLGVPAYLDWQGMMTDKLTEQVTQLLQLAALVLLPTLGVVMTLAALRTGK